MLKRGCKSKNKSIFIDIKEKCINYIKSNSSISIIAVYNLITAILSISFYPIIPALLNYPPNTEEVSRALGTSTIMQYVFLISYACIVGSIFLRRALKPFRNWDKLDSNNADDIKRILEIRRRSMNLPMTIFLLELLIVNIPTVFIGLIVTTLNNSPKLVIIKVITMSISLYSLAAVSTYIFSKRIFKRILLKTYIGEMPEGRRLSLKKDIFIQIIPMLLVVIIFATLMGYSRLITEKGDFMYNIYKGMLSERLSKPVNIKSAQNAFYVLGEIKSGESNLVYFAKSPSGTIVTSNGSVLGGYYQYYIDKPYAGDRMYELNAETQGIVASVAGEGGEWKIGFIYQVTSSRSIGFFLIGLVVLLLLNIMVLYYFVSSLSGEISLVAKSLLDIANMDDISKCKSIPVTSNNEVSDLVMAFNKIMERQFQYDELKTEFVANVSHELRTPINVIYSAIQVFGMYSKDGLYPGLEKPLKNITAIKQNCLKLMRLVNNLIDTTKIDAGYLNLKVQSLNIVSLIKEITDYVGDYAKSKDITLKFDTEANEKIIDCDEDKIETIILNLLSNAIKFTQQGGNIYVKVYDNGDNILISIKDTGIGIPRSKQQLIFERFRQIDQSLIRSYEGSGIGLSLVKSLVEMHNGKIYVESEEGLGSEFVILLPVKAIDAAEYRTEDHISNTSHSSRVHKVKIELSDIYLSK